MWSPLGDAGGDAYATDDIGVDIEVAAQLPIEGFDIPDVDDRDALGQAVDP